MKRRAAIEPSFNTSGPGVSAATAIFRFPLLYSEFLGQGREKREKTTLCRRCQLRTDKKCRSMFYLIYKKRAASARSCPAGIIYKIEYNYGIKSLLGPGNFPDIKCQEVNKL
ncbi:MAG: hypothetical protein JRF02_06605 [Deltaproteobacteria bacterium]|jgi:hypothetical protein|nr:hypothetical protein [Deltaproteobacteria bacterium]